MSSSQLIIIVLSVFLILWYIGANIYNRRRGIAAYHWLRRGLQQLGTISNAEWLGSSGTGAKLAVSKADKPFRQVEAAYFLETREILPWWVVARLRGKRDEIVLSASLRTGSPHIGPHPCTNRY